MREYTQALGTPEYISPEQVKGKRGDARSDLYSMGIMLYEMLSGKTPFSGPSPLAVMNDRLINHPVPPRVADPGISPQLQEVLYRAIEREPRNRYPSAHAFAWDLEHLDQVGVAERAELTDWKRRRFADAAQGFSTILALALLPFCDCSFWSCWLRQHRYIQRSFRRASTAPDCAGERLRYSLDSAAGRRALTRAFADEPGGIFMESL